MNLSIENVIRRTKCIQPKYNQLKQATKETSSLWGKLNFEETVIKPDGPSSADKQKQFDRKLNLSILPPAPALHVSFTPIPCDVLAGEIIPVTVYLTNAGAESLTDIYVVSEAPRSILGEIDNQELPLSLLRGILINKSQMIDTSFFIILLNFDSCIRL